MKILRLSLVASALFGGALCAAETRTLTPNLADIPSERGWKLINRAASLIDKGGTQAIHLEGKDGTGFVRLENFTLADGTIAFDARGKNVVQQSFLGLAFHGADVKAYDAIYFRPFNFRSDDPVRRSHAVQYIAHPTFTWQKLRAEHPGQYEKPVAPVPQPDGWFHVRVVIAVPRVSVFVNDAAEPCLVVEQISARRRGWIALWTDVRGGDFANLKITVATTP